MDHLPIWLSLEGSRVTIVGSGLAAVAKARIAAKAGAEVVIASPSITDHIQTVIGAGLARHESCEYLQFDPSGSSLIFVATEHVESDRAVAALSRQAGVLVNVVDRPDSSDFLMPAIIDRGAVVVGISTGGVAPALAANIRTKIESILHSKLGILANFSGFFRDTVRDAFPLTKDRIRFWRKVFNGIIAEDVLAGREEKAHEEMKLALKATPEQSNISDGEILLVGAGPGDPELLTVKALRLIQEADVVVYDRLVADNILEYARRDAEQIYVGKKMSQHSIPQERIHEILLDRHQKGLKVVRLKGGDPFIFGRGGEEADALRAAGINVKVVPGITAALGCAASAGIPLTHRDYTGAVTLITGHSQAKTDVSAWSELVKLNHTLVIYMGVSNSESITNQLLESGVSETIPVAVIENGSLPDERIFTGQLNNLERLIKENNIKAPALLIIGEVAEIQSIKEQISQMQFAEVG